MGRQPTSTIAKKTEYRGVMVAVVTERIQRRTTKKNESSSDADKIRKNLYPVIYI
jgi:hypothetical protein